MILHMFNVKGYTHTKGEINCDIIVFGKRPVFLKKIICLQYVLYVITTVAATVLTAGSIFISELLLVHVILVAIINFQCEA